MLKIERRHLVGATAGLLVLLAACTAPIIGTPTAQDIAAKPAHSGLKDAHFTITGHIVSGAADVQIKGEGLMVFKPASASRMALTGALGVLPFSIELISVGGNDYQRVGNAKWTKTTSNVKPASGDSWATAKDLKLIGEENLSQGKAWHLKGTADGKPFELWVRESDGYPLKYVNGDPNASLTLTFDQFDTGQRISEPASTDIKPEPKNATGAIGRPVHLNGVDVTVASVNPNYKSANQFITPKPDNRFVVVEVLYQSTGSEPVEYNQFDWTVSDGQGFSYRPSFSDKDPQLRSGQLDLGGKARGFITFEIPTTAQGLVVKAKVGDDSASVPLA
jgi:hypothetical protein